MEDFYYLLCALLVIFLIGAFVYWNTKDETKKSDKSQGDSGSSDARYKKGKFGASVCDTSYTYDTKALDPNNLDGASGSLENCNACMGNREGQYNYTSDKCVDDPYTASVGPGIGDVISTNFSCSPTQISCNKPRAIVSYS